MKFTEILRELRVPFFTEGRHCRPGWVQFHCPWCRGGSDPTKPYCGYNLQFGYVNCWRCGNHSVYDLLVVLSGLPRKRCRELAGDLERGRTPFPDVERRGKLVLPRHVGPMLPAHIKYLQKRGLDAEAVVELWGLKGIGQCGELPWRVFIPIMLHGETVSWTTRTIGNSASRYISASAEQEVLNHRELLYGEDFVRHAVLVTEGPGDVWRIGPGAVATMGTGYTPAQVLRISKYAKRGICFDLEPDAQRRARRLCDALKVFPGETYNIVLDSKDPGSASEEEVAELRSFLED